MPCIKFRVISSALFCILLLASNLVIAEWLYVESSDPFEDHDTSSISPDIASYSYENELALAVKCEFDGLNFQLTHSYMLGDSDEEVSVLLRIDNNEVYGPEYWSLQANTISWMPLQHVKNIVEEMKSGDRMAIRITDLGDGEQLAEDVSLDGFSSSIERLSCYN